MKRDITICLPFYLNQGMLEHQLVHFQAMGKSAKKHVRLIVVDDGSPTPAKVVHPEKLDFHFSLFRMGVDVPWNQDACRNLAVAQAKTDWVLLTDMDHVVPENTLTRCTEGPLDATCVYTFARVTAPAMEPYKPHPNSWLMTREMYDRIGGYDERYAGIYGTDGIFSSAVARHARKVLALKEPLIRCPREYIPDASTTTLTRKSEAAKEARVAVSAGIKAQMDAIARPVRGRFPWKRVL